MTKELPKKKMDFSLSFKEFWGVETIPFLACSDFSNAVIFGPERQSVFETLLSSACIPGTYCILQGEPGVGKSFLARKTYDALEDSTVIPIFLTIAEDILSPNWLLKKLDRICLKNHLCGFFDYLDKISRQEQSVCLILDGAHRLMNGSAWEDCLSLVDLQSSVSNFLSWVFFFDSSNTAILTLPPQLMMRLTYQYTLPPFTHDETASYINHNLKAVGLNLERTFKSDTLFEIVQKSEGKPASINAICFEKMQKNMLNQRSGKVIDQTNEKNVSDEKLPKPRKNTPAKEIQRKILKKNALDEFLKVDKVPDNKKTGS